MADIQQMISRGEIHIGRPWVGPNERLVVIKDEGRYAIETKE